MPTVYTPTQKRRRAWLLARGAKQAIAGPVDRWIENELDRLEERGEERWAAESAAAGEEVRVARSGLAAARVAERNAPRGPERAVARKARKQAEQALRRAEQTVRRYR